MDLRGDMDGTGKGILMPSISLLLAVPLHKLFLRLQRSLTFLLQPSLFLNLFLIEGWLLYNIVLASAIHQHESAIGIHMSPPS